MRLSRALAALALAAALAVPAILAGCGGSSVTTAPEHPFGAPPAPAPGVRAWAAGETGALLVTTDGGASWKRQKFFLPQRGVDVAFPDAQTGWLVTDAGTVLATADGGVGWTVVEKVKLDVKAMAAADAEDAWLAGNSVGAAGGPGASAVLRTTDGGETWKRTPFGDALLTDIAFSDARHGVLVALDRIWSTRDGGRTWHLRKQRPHDRADKRGRRRRTARLGRRLGHPGRGAARLRHPRRRRHLAPTRASMWRRPSPTPCRRSRSPAPARPGSG